MVPLSVATGNVTVSFIALSYDNHLVITMTADPKTCPDVDRLLPCPEVPAGRLLMRVDSVVLGIRNEAFSLGERRRRRQPSEHRRERSEQSNRARCASSSLTSSSLI